LGLYRSIFHPSMKLAHASFLPPGSSPFSFQDNLLTGSSPAANQTQRQQLLYMTNFPFILPLSSSPSAVSSRPFRLPLMKNAAFCFVMYKNIFDDTVASSFNLCSSSCIASCGRSPLPFLPSFFSFLLVRQQRRPRTISDNATIFLHASRIAQCRGGRTFSLLMCHAKRGASRDTFLIYIAVAVCVDSLGCDAVPQTHVLGRTSVTESRVDTFSVI
jgi:hypothetical protein